MGLIQSPAPYNGGGRAVYLSGPVDGCVDWQADAAAMVQATDPKLAVFNPRRRVVPVDEHAVREQVRWEQEKLRMARVVLFWFPADGEDGFALYVLGQCLQRRQPVALGASGAYRRRDGLLAQVSQAWRYHGRNPDRVCDRLADTAADAVVLAQ